MKKSISLFSLGLMLMCVYTARGSIEPKSREIWYRANDLANRLNAEKWKLGVVRQEIGRLQIAMEALREVQSYPAELTNLSLKESSRWDGIINNIRKRSSKALSLLEDMERPIDDAVNIAKEMMKACPNQDMMDLLIEDNVQRIKKLVRVKKYVDRLWEDISSIMRAYEKLAGIRREESDKGPVEDVFLKVLISQSGQSSNFFYKDLHNYKDFIAGKASDSQCVLMVQMDLNLLKKRLESEDLKRLQKDLTRMSERYEKRIPIGSVYYLLGEVNLRLRDFQKSRRAYIKVSQASSFFEKSRLGLLQVFFELGQDDSLIVLYKSLVSDTVLKAGDLQAARYMAAQSLYALGDYEGLEALILSFENKNRFYYKSLFIYTKSLISLRRDSEASEILKSVIKQTQLPDNLKKDARLDLAYLKYEQGYFKSALKDFNLLIDKSGYQPHAFFGIAWCYIKLKDWTNAQFALKKLINQYPDSPLAIEALLTLSRWQFSKAIALWKYWKATNSNRGRLLSYQKILGKKLAEGRIPREVATEIKNKLALGKMNIASRLKISLHEIDSLFQEALLLNEFVQEHYTSGEFSEVTFSDERERVLGKLDVIGKLKGSRKKPKVKKALQIRVSKALQLHFDMIWYYKYWLGERLANINESERTSMAKQSAHINSSNVPDSDREEEIRLNQQLREKISLFNQKCLEILDILISDPLSAEQRDKIFFFKALVLFEAEKNKMKREAVKRGVLDSLFPESALFARMDNRGYGDDESEKLWTLVLREYPNSDYIPLSLFYLGKAHVLQNDLRGLVLLEDFIDEFPDHRYKEHSLSLIGDYFFKGQEYIKATETFHRILQFPSSNFFERTLYMQAWTYYSSGQYKKALKAFRLILEEQMAEAPLQELFKSPYFNETVKMLANNYAELDTTGPRDNAPLKSFTRQFKNKKLKARFLHQIAVVFRQQGRLAKSRRIMQIILKKFTRFEDLPHVMMDLAVAYDIENQHQQSLKIREKVFQDYNRKGKWYAGLTDDYYKNKTDSLCSVALENIAFHYFAQAKIGKNGENSAEGDSILNKSAYMKAIGAYEKFLEIYPEYKDAAKSYYLLAESYFEIKRYYKAAFMYLKASKTNDENLKIAASYNAVIAAQKHVDNMNNEL